MMEMREGKEGKEAPPRSSQQKNIMKGVAIASALTALGLWGLAAYVWFLQDGRMPAFLLFIFGLVMAGLGWYTFGKLQSPDPLSFKNEMRQDGYSTSLINRRTGNARELFIPYSSMKEILLAKTARYRVNADQRPGDYWIGASLVMKWTDKGGRLQFALFQEDDPARLKEWLTIYRQHGIPVYASDEYIGTMPAEEYKHCYGQIAKHTYEENLDGHVGYSETNPPRMWRRQLKTARTEKLAAVNGVRKWGYFALLAVNGLAGWLWIPDWHIETVGDTFVETSWILAFFAANILMFILFGGYWRKSSGWYRPLLDSFLVLAAQSAGLVIALAGTDKLSLIWNALIVDGVAFAAYLTGAYLFTRFVLSRWL